MKISLKILLLLAFAAAILPLSSVSAQTPVPGDTQAKPRSQADVKMQVIPAFEGAFKYGEWLPLSIELTNDGADLREAEVRVRVPRNTGGVTFSEPVSLPAGAHKIVTLYILPNNYSHSLNVELVSGGEVLTSEKAAMRPMMNINVIIGLVAPERGALSLLNGIQYENNNRPVQVVDVKLWQLPNHMEALRSFDILVINKTDTSKLSPEQGRALTGWVQSGGRLVLGGGDGAPLTLAGLPDELLPVKINGSMKLSADDLQDLARFADGQEILAGGEFVVSQAESYGGARSLALTGDKDASLIFERSAGKGQIDFVALDLSSSPFEGWSSSPRFWEKLLRTSEDFFNQPTDISQRSLRASSLIGALTLIPSMELPSIKWLALILGIYILIVGPVNYLVLKRKNRLHWAWVTIPAATLLFSGAAFGSGYLMKGNDLLVHKLGIVEIQPGGSAAVTSYMGLFSPSQKSYQVEIPGGSLLSPIMSDGMYYGGAATEGELTIQHGQPSILKGLSVSQWSMQSFMTEETIPEFGRISGQLRLEDGRLRGTVRNELKSTLKDVTIILRNQYSRLGDLQPGEEVSVDFDPTPNLTMWGMPVYYSMYEDQMAAGNIPNNERALIDLKRSMLSPLFDYQLMPRISSAVAAAGGGGGATPASTASNQNVAVLGWIDELPPEIQVAGEAVSVQTLGLVFDNLYYDLSPEGRIVMPPGILQGKVLDSNAGMCGPMDSVSLFFERGSEATVEYQLPDPERFEFSQLNLHIISDQSPGLSLPVTSFFDWKNDKWVKFSDIAVGTNTIRSPARFIGANGEVRMELTYNEKSQMGGCIFMNMGFTGQGKGGVQ